MMLSPKNETSYFKALKAYLDPSTFRETCCRVGYLANLGLVPGWMVVCVTPFMRIVRNTSSCQKLCTWSIPKLN